MDTIAYLCNYSGVWPGDERNRYETMHHLILAVTGRSPIVISIICTLLVVIPARGAGETTDYLAFDGLAEKAIEQIVKSTGRTTPVLSIDIGKKSVRMLVQAGSGKNHVDKWAFGTVRKLFRDVEELSGPEPVRDTGPVGDVSGGFFDLNEVALDQIEKVKKAALDYAGIETDARITAISIKRRISIVPSPSYQDVRWTVTVESPRESASVVTDIGGRIIGADLSNTQRGKLLDVRRDDWVLPLIPKELKPVIATGKTVWMVSFSKSAVVVTVDHPTDPKLTRNYIWRLGQIQRSLVDAPSARKLGSQIADRMDPELAPSPPWVVYGRPRAFAFLDLDLALLPELKTTARELLQLPDGQITSIGAEQTFGMPKVQWSIKIESRDRKKKGTATFDVSGKLIEVHPADRLEKSPDKSVKRWAIAVKRERQKDPELEKQYKIAKELHFAIMTQDDELAMYHLGLMYAKGQGVPKDNRRAVHWMQRAAQKGQTDAVYPLGTMTFDGSGIEQDVQAAIKLFRQAADQGHANAMLNLAFIYNTGREVERDDLKAAQLMFDSVRAGSDSTLKELTGNFEVWGEGFRSEFQRLLKTQGLYSGSVTGTFDPETLAAITRLAGKS